jgi:hypothetical protein
MNAASTEQDRRRKFDMSKVTSRTVAALLTIFIFTFAAVAVAQTPPAEVPELESDQLVDEGLVEAKILEMNSEERTMTVRFDATKDTAKLIVPENAYIALTFPNELERRIELDELSVGDNIMVQTVVVDEIVEVRIIGVAS